MGYVIPKQKKGLDKNVAIIRLRRNTVRVELQVNKDKMPSAEDLRKAKNKYPWNIDDVVIVRTIFANAVKGEPVPPQDLEKAFAKGEGDDDDNDDDDGNKKKKKKGGASVMSEDERILLILNKGELQLKEEDRQKEDKQVVSLLASISAAMAKRAFAVPSDPEASEKKSKKKDKVASAVRLERFNAEVLERELKNAKFKLNPNSSENEQLREAFRAIRDKGDTKLYRDGRMLALTAASENEVAKVVSEFGKLDCPCWREVGRSGPNVHIVADGDWVDSKRLSSLPFCELNVNTTIHIPQGEDDDLVLIPAAAAPARNKAEKSKPKEKPVPKASAVAVSESESSESESDDDAANSLAKELAKLKAGADDSDDDRRGGKRGGKAKHADPATSGSGEGSKKKKKK